MASEPRQPTEGVHDPIRSHAHAAQTLDDVPFLAYCLVQAAKLFVALIAKRWPQLR